MSGGERLRVAAYCRVSTAQEDQLHSLAQQQRYFAEYIRGRPGWELAGVYADRGLSGTTARRPAFQRMLAAAQAGEVDLILTREVSRFARNTVDALAHTRALRRAGVGVVFIADNIDTRQSDGEFRLTIMASMAQEESRKISERVKWGQRRSMEQGVVFGSNNIYGFDLRGGRLSVKPEQAAVIRTVYHKFLHEGKGTHVIARELTEAGIPPPRARDRPWSSTMVLRLLRNEKYCGDLLQKKTCTPDFLDHRAVKNDGLEEKVYLPGHHEAIVPRQQFDAVQRELARRAPHGGRKTRHSARYWCSGRLVCAVCGSRFVPRRRMRADGTEYRFWACRARVQHGRAGCAMHTVPHGAVGAGVAYLLDRLGIDAGRAAAEAAALCAKTAGMDGKACRAFLTEKALADGAAYAALVEEITIAAQGMEVRLRGVPGRFRLAAEDWERGTFCGCERVQDDRG